MDSVLTESPPHPLTGWNLVVDRVPSYAIINRPLMVRVSLKNERNMLAYHPCTIRVVAHLEDSNELQPVILGDGKCDSMPLAENGQREIPVIFPSLSPRTSAGHLRRAVLKITGTVGEEEFWSVESVPIACVRHHLVIEDDLDKNYEKPVMKHKNEDGRPRNVFFKDKGGKDKGIEIVVKLMNEDDQLINSRDILLKPVLLYSDGDKVQDQSILTISNDRSGGLMLQNGTARVKFRINQVSTKHCDREFCIQIMSGASDETGVSDIAPAVGVPILVLSKTNNKNPVSTGTPPYKKVKLTPMNGGGSNMSASGMSDVSPSLIDQLAEARASISQWTDRAVTLIANKCSDPQARDEIISQYKREVCDKFGTIDRLHAKLSGIPEPLPPNLMSGSGFGMNPVFGDVHLQTKMKTEPNHQASINNLTNQFINSLVRSSFNPNANSLLWSNPLIMSGQAQPQLMMSQMPYNHNSDYRQPNKETPMNDAASVLLALGKKD